jgi:hypothetical protein
MVKLQRVRTPIVATRLTATALVSQRLAAYLPAPPPNGLNQILAAISVRPTIRHPLTPFLQPLALPVELPGNVEPPLYSTRRGAAPTRAQARYRRQT